MLPPQSGHTQFRMPDITAALTITCIPTSMNDKEPSTAGPLQIVHILAVRKAERKCCVHFAFQNILKTSPRS
jgi:hypothetical protein